MKHAHSKILGKVFASGGEGGRGDGEGISGELPWRYKSRPIIIG